MSASISGCVQDGATGKQIGSADVRLYKIGVVGETRAVVDEDGRFSFQGLSHGEYSLGVYAPQYVSGYERIALDPNQTVEDLRITLTIGGFLSGQILDENGHPPDHCWFTLLREGERSGQFGYVNSFGDHDVSKDGAFCSPPLPAGEYLLRFAGILRKPAIQDSSMDSPEPLHVRMQRRVFDFLYPNANDVTKASGFLVETGQRTSDAQIRIPRPVWHTVRGKVTGLPSPDERANIYVDFARDIGAIGKVCGGAGAPVRPDGSFEHMAQPGRYFVDINETAPPEPDGRTHLIRRFRDSILTVGDQDLSGVELHAGPASQFPIA